MSGSLRGMQPFINYNEINTCLGSTVALLPSWTNSGNDVDVSTC